MFLQILDQYKLWISWHPHWPISITKTKFCSLKGLVVFLFTRKDESAIQRLKRKKIVLYFGLSHLLSINAWTICSFKNHSILVNIRCICTVGSLAISCVGAPFCCFLPVADIFSREWLGCSYRFLLFSSCCPFLLLGREVLPRKLPELDHLYQGSPPTHHQIMPPPLGFLFSFISAGLPATFYYFPFRFPVDLIVFLQCKKLLSVFTYV